MKGLYKFYFACVVAVGFVSYSTLHSLHKGTGQNVKYKQYKDFQESYIVQNLALVPEDIGKGVLFSGSQRRLLQDEEDVEVRAEAMPHLFGWFRVQELPREITYL